MHSDLVISRADGRPMYVQIMEQIRNGWQWVTGPGVRKSPRFGSSR